MTDLHVKPTREELEANAQAALKALEASPKPSEPIPSEPEPSTPIPEPKPSEPAPSEPEPTPSKPIPTPEEDEELKKKLSASAREAQVLGFKNKELNKAIDDAAGLPEPTVDELKQVYTDWDSLDATTQQLAKDNLLNKRKFDMIHGATMKFKQVDEWNGKVDSFISDPKTLIANPDLEGKTEEFKQFASKPTRRGLEFEDLVLAFFGDRAKNRPAPKKGKMFETGSGGGAGPKNKPDDGKISVAEGRLLMKADYKKWVEYLKSGKIRNE